MKALKDLWHYAEVLDEVIGAIEVSEDCISKAYLEQEIENHLLSTENLRTEKDEWWNKGFEVMVEIIEDAPSVIPKPKEGEWIPCSERLPSEFSDDERVLVTTDVDEMGVIFMPIYDVKSWYRKGCITAWMPLPEPWKGADDDL